MSIISDDKLIAESFNEYFINVGINIGTESEQFYEISSDNQIPESGSGAARTIIGGGGGGGGGANIHICAFCLINFF